MPRSPYLERMLASGQDDAEDTTIYRVVVNHEEQYSIWPTYKELPLGWSEGGPTGSKAECLAYIETAWTDMRPLSLRKAMERAEGENQGVGRAPAS
jgi:MbtH protein